jgi:predicted nucleic acid-binding protein
MNYLLDSDILINFFNLKEESTFLIKNFVNRNEHLYISTVTIIEMRSGWPEEIAKDQLKKLYGLCDVVNVDKEIAELAGNWRQKYKTKGIQLQVPDSIIAATAYLNNYCLVTNNKKDYPMPELSLY